MPKYAIKIELESQSETQVKELGNLIQFAVNNINRDELVKLLAKVKTNPGIVKTALKFI